jgi:rhodanese-related sulfurtransferase
MMRQYLSSSACLWILAGRSLQPGVSAFTAALGRSRSMASLGGSRSISLPTLGKINTGRYLSSSSDSEGGDDTPPPIRHIRKDEMKEILMEHEELVTADLESPYFVLDVRSEEEVLATGKVSPSVPTIPVQALMPPYSALEMDEEEFLETFGFVKPDKDLQMVFTCAAGIRSVYACKAAQTAGYSNCINYMGGANEFFLRVP